jgi:hypothetical protein
VPLLFVNVDKQNRVEVGVEPHEQPNWLQFRLPVRHPSESQEESAKPFQKTASGEYLTHSDMFTLGPASFLEESQRSQIFGLDFYQLND